MKRRNTIKQIKNDEIITDEDEKNTHTHRKIGFFGDDELVIAID